MIALDTQMWVWFHLGNERLPPEVAQAVGRETILSAVSVWEVMLLLEKGRISSPHSPKATIKLWLDAAPLRIVPVDAEIAILSRTLAFKHDDPADRFIAATAYRERVTLATSDIHLRALDWLKTI